LIVNDAVTALDAFIVTVHVPVPKQPPPDQPVNVDPKDDDAVRVTLSPLTRVSAQSAPQLMPAGVLVMVPSPVPALLTLRSKSRRNSAVTVRSSFMEILQPPVPKQPFVHRTKTEPVAGVAETVTDDPWRNVFEHAAPQLIPDGRVTNVPSPSPTFSTDRRGSIRAEVDDVAVAPSSSVTLSTTV
jgi:hypothetical protein